MTRHAPVRLTIAPQTTPNSNEVQAFAAVGQHALPDGRPRPLSSLPVTLDSNTITRDIFHLEIENEKRAASNLL